MTSSDRSCETDLQCKERCKCWVSLECEDPPETTKAPALTEAFSDYSQESTYQNAVSQFIVSIISDVERWCWGHWHRHQSRVDGERSWWYLDLLRLLILSLCKSWHWGRPRIDGEGSWWYLDWFLLLSIVWVPEIILEEAVVVDAVLKEMMITLLLSRVTLCSRPDCRTVCSGCPLYTQHIGRSSGSC